MNITSPISEAVPSSAQLDSDDEKSPNNPPATSDKVELDLGEEQHVRIRTNWYQFWYVPIVLFASDHLIVLRTTGSPVRSLALRPLPWMMQRCVLSFLIISFLRSKDHTGRKRVLLVQIDIYVDHTHHGMVGMNYSLSLFYMVFRSLDTKEHYK
jgi:hypothetical protein